MTIAKAKVIRDSAGGALEIPILLTDHGPLPLLIEYQLENVHRRPSWHRRLNFSVGLLIEYAEANPAMWSAPEELFRMFAWRLSTGTLEKGEDPSGLYWLPRRSNDARSIIAKLTDFSRHLAAKHHYAELNPRREATVAERVMNLAALRYRSDARFLGHLDRPADMVRAASVTSRIQFETDPTILSEDVKPFPEDRFRDLLTEGFAVRKAATAADRINCRDALITLLLHGGGLRTSECFHLWMCDVQSHPSDPAVAWVRIGHPRLGSSDGSSVQSKDYLTRAAYLAQRGLKPRDLVMGMQHAGWKNPALDRRYYLEVHWSDPEYGRLFMALWLRYLDEASRLSPRHPWAFIVLQGPKAGEPYPISYYRHSYERAIRRIGLTPKSASGTRPHGHRHAYGQRLKQRGCSLKTIKNCMHHSSLESQRVYTEEIIQDINRELEEGYKRAHELAGSSKGALFDGLEGLLPS